jgi:hypothetical protein
MSDPSGEVFGFPVARPAGVTWVWRPDPEPIVGPPAKDDLREIKQGNRRLARRLLREVMNLLDRNPSKVAKKIPDPPAVGPRYVIDLCEGYVAVYWVLEPGDDARGAGPAMWVERVILRAELEAALVAMTSSET